MRWSVKALNDLLAQEMGRNIYGEPIFRWEWSETLFWPATATGRLVDTPVTGYLIGGGIDKIMVPKPEYKRSRMCINHRNQWVVTKWLNPAELVGLVLDYRHGDMPREIDYPREMILDRWLRRFPGADYPERGLHVITDYYCKPGMTPFYEDTKFLIAQLREQRSGMNFGERQRDMLEDRQAKLDRTQRLTEDIVEDCFTAYLNPEPGSRGYFVNFPDPKAKPTLDFTSIKSEPIQKEQ